MAINLGPQIGPWAKLCGCLPAFDPGAPPLCVALRWSFPPRPNPNPNCRSRPKSIRLRRPRNAAASSDRRTTSWFRSSRSQRLDFLILGRSTFPLHFSSSLRAAFPPPCGSCILFRFFSFLLLLTKNLPIRPFVFFWAISFSGFRLGYLADSSPSRVILPTNPVSRAVTGWFLWLTVQGVYSFGISEICRVLLRLDKIWGMLVAS